MRILIAAATWFEIVPIVRAFADAPSPGPSLRGYTFAGHEVHVLVTGVGMVATAAWTSRALATQPYDLALNVGICGSFDHAIEPGRVVHVVADRIAELGAEDGDAFLSLEELGLTSADALPDSGKALENPAPPDSLVLRSLPAVSGITVNTVHGHPESIAAVSRRYRPEVESMEGAAFMYTCLIHGVAFAQVRAVSNIVERRNREAWQIQEAVTALSVAAIGILETL